MLFLLRLLCLCICHGGADFGRLRLRFATNRRHVTTYRGLTMRTNKLPDFGKELRRPFEVHENCYDCVEFYDGCDNPTKAEGRRRDYR